MSTGALSSEPAALRRLLADLQQLEREIVELEYVRRSDALDRVREAVRRLGEVGSPEGILDRAAEELGSSSQFDRILISELDNQSLRPRTIWAREDPAAAASALAELRTHSIRLEYPLVEDEVARGQHIEIVTVSRAGSRAPAALTDALAWDAYVVAALTVDGRTVGLLHADVNCTPRALDELDREVVARFCEGLAGVFERAALRETLRRHRSELQVAIQWMSSRLTRRELEVLRLLARGQTNLAIAGTLLVREGTVKYHVKNILRKLGATSRADAVARYVRASGAAEAR
jgi:DNA-binding NarL/FixJ family response regulator